VTCETSRISANTNDDDNNPLRPPTQHGPRNTITRSIPKRGQWVDRTKKFVFARHVSHNRRVIVSRLGSQGLLYNGQFSHLLLEGSWSLLAIPLLCIMSSCKPPLPLPNPLVTRLTIPRRRQLPPAAAFPQTIPAHTYNSHQNQPCIFTCINHNHNHDNFTTQT
jgi:hypothetical protein